MNTNNLIFFAINYLLSYALFSGDFFEPKQNNVLWEETDWPASNPQDSIYWDDYPGGGDESDSETDSETYRFKNRYNFLYEEPKEELFQAIFDRNLEQVSSLLENVQDLEIINENIGLTPLFYAASIGAKEIVKLLLEKGADCYGNDLGLDSIAHFSIARKEADALRAILEYSKEFYLILDHDGNTLLHSAITSGSYEVFDTVLNYCTTAEKNYIDFSQANKSGNNVLFLCAELKLLDYFDILIDRFYKEISYDDLVSDRQSIFHKIFGYINKTSHYWCPTARQMKKSAKYFNELLNYIDERTGLTPLDLLLKKREESVSQQMKANHDLIERLICLVKENGGKTAQEVSSFTIKSGNSHY